MTSLWVGLGTAAIGAAGSYAASRQNSGGGGAPPAQLSGPQAVSGTLGSYGGMTRDPVTGLVTQSTFGFNPTGMSQNLDAQSMWNQFMGRGNQAQTSDLDFQIKALQQKYDQMSKPGATGTAAVPAEFRGIQPYVDKEKGGLWAGTADPDGIKNGKYGEQGKLVMEDFAKFGSAYGGDFNRWLRDHIKNNDITGKVAQYEKTVDATKGNEEVNTAALNDLKNQMDYLTQQKARMSDPTQQGSNPLMDMMSNTGPEWGGKMDNVNPFTGQATDMTNSKLSQAGADPSEFMQKYGAMPDTAGQAGYNDMLAKMKEKMGLAGSASPEQMATNNQSPFAGDYRSLLGGLKGPEMAQGFVNPLTGMPGPAQVDTSAGNPYAGGFADIAAQAQGALGQDAYGIMGQNGVDSSGLRNVLAGLQGPQMANADPTNPQATNWDALVQSGMSNLGKDPMDYLKQFGIGGTGQGSLQASINGLSGSGQRVGNAPSAPGMDANAAGAMRESQNWQAAQAFGGQRKLRDATAARRGLLSSSVNELADVGDREAMIGQTLRNNMDAAKYGNDLEAQRYGMQAQEAALNADAARANNADDLARQGMKLNYMNTGLSQANLGASLGSQWQNQALSALQGAGSADLAYKNYGNNAIGQNNAANLSFGNRDIAGQQALFGQGTEQTKLGQDLQSTWMSQALAAQGAGNSAYMGDRSLQNAGIGQNNASNLAFAGLGLDAAKFGNTANNAAAGQNNAANNAYAGLQSGILGNADSSNLNYLGLNNSAIQGNNASNLAYRNANNANDLANNQFLVNATGQGLDRAFSQGNTSAGLAANLQNTWFNQAMSALNNSNQMAATDRANNVQDYTIGRDQNNTQNQRASDMWTRLQQQSAQAAGLQNQRAGLANQQNQMGNQTNMQFADWGNQANQANAQMQNSYNAQQQQMQAQQNAANTQMWSGLGQAGMNMFGRFQQPQTQPQNQTLASVQNGTYRAQPVADNTPRPNPATDPYATFNR